MSWNDVAVVAESAASLAVVVSLVYLGIQVRLQAKANQMSVINSLTQQWSETLLAFATQKEMYDIWMRGLANFDALSTEERGRFSSILVNFTQILEGLHLHHRSGRIDPELWEGLDNRLRDIFATPGVQAWWPLRKHWHTRRFQRYVDRVIATCQEQQGRYLAIYGAQSDGTPGSQSEATSPQ